MFCCGRIPFHVLVLMSIITDIYINHATKTEKHKFDKQVDKQIDNISKEHYREMGKLSSQDSYP